ncbi:ATP-binding protein [Paenibacillus allorhizosphaerae]|uniref:ATP-dependent zinc metalloprotease FtsH n=1 Tax=Paenibacillus allorhizosphaerae TaxID=2849866 RepID=A0ABM8VH64_9BACL|nr:AAA family ATPase [Paenibacillus allorhizosphaerae]CAG7640873.1 ATP-dependent zinc metalloprotease FtsH [Paenibacillus allorhizosphaerae]
MDELQFDGSHHEKSQSGGYGNYASYVSDLLTWLDMALWIQLKLQPQTSPDPMERLKGIVITEGEIIQLLNDPAKNLPPDPQLQMLQTQLKDWERHLHQKVAQTPSSIFLPLKSASTHFQLSPFEEYCLFICLAVELDRKYERCYGYLQDDITCKHPTVELVLQLLCPTREERTAALAYLAPNSKLSSYFFVQSPDSGNGKGSILSRTLRLDDKMIYFLLGEPLAPQSGDMYDFMPVGPSLPALLLDEDIQMRMLLFADQAAVVQRPLLFYVWGSAGSGKKLQVRHYAKARQKKAISIKLRRLSNDPERWLESIHAILREGILHQAILCFEDAHLLIEDTQPLHKRLPSLLGKLSSYTHEIFLLSAVHWKPYHLPDNLVYSEVQIPLTAEGDRLKLWEKLGASYTFADPIDWGMMAGKFRFSTGQIEQALEKADQLAKWGHPDQPAIRMEELHEACYAQVQHKLERKAMRIRPKRGWDDIILPPEQKLMLRQACSHITYRHIVYGEWGFERKLSYGKGLSLLFAGPPGTGKTMSAEVIAKELYLEIYKIDLSQVISKYIGETEKNLSEIFQEAQHSNAILFFDEADALFGKRSEVKDAHDKYANTETAYLLQKMEEYDGITILATNYSQNIDEAFLRRITYIVKFPFPDEAHRESIWRSIYPQETLLGKDIDYRFLARKLQVAGGNIKNIALSSAFLAAQAQEPVGMKHILLAAKQELQKNGKLLLKEDLGDYLEFLKT